MKKEMRIETDDRVEHFALSNLWLEPLEDSYNIKGIGYQTGKEYLIGKSVTKKRAQRILDKYNMDKVSGEYIHVDTFLYDSEVAHRSLTVFTNYN